MFSSSKLTLKARYTSTIWRWTSTTPDTKAVQPPNAKKITSDMVGPPDPISNLRKIIFKQPSNETRLEKRYRELRMEVQEWNQKFWTQHNSRFFLVILCNLYYVTYRKASFHILYSAVKICTNKCAIF